MSDWAELLMTQAREALPPIEGGLRVPGLRDSVEVVRDRWGVPHIYASSLPDVFCAQGFVMGQERTFQTDFVMRLATGRLSELIGEFAVSLDRFFRTVGLNRAGRRVAAGYDERSLMMAESILAGYRAGVASLPSPPVEYRILELDPPTFDDDALGMEAGAAVAALMSWTLSGNWDAELLRVEIAERLGFEAMLALFPDVAGDPSVVVPGKDGGDLSRRRALDILRAAPLVPKGQGSNNWVVAGSRSVTGKPLLANDPHLRAMLPSIWFECHLVAPGLDVRGVTLPGAPGVVIGHTPHHAWGETNVGGDTQDLYLERLSEDGSSALYEDAWEPLIVHSEEIFVRGRDEPEVLSVRESRHGPILDSYMVGIGDPTVVAGGVRETYALRWVGASHGIQPSVLLDLAQATDFASFRSALRGWESPGQNFVYADVDGNIGYQCTGLHPIRRRGHDGTLPVPGWTSEFEWDGWVPFDELPWSENPSQGFIATANQKIHDDSYPYELGKDFLPNVRARRIVRLLSETELHSASTFAAIHRDTQSEPARDIASSMASLEPADDRQKAALAVLDGWDGDLAADSVAGGIYEVWCKHLSTALLLPKLGQELFDHFYGRRQWTNAFQVQVLPVLLRNPSAPWFEPGGVPARDAVLSATLDAALDELTATLGEDMDGWRWGALHRIRFAHPLAILPGLEELFVAGEIEIGGDEQTISQGMFEPGVGYDAVVVSSWRQIIDLANTDASIGTNTIGQSGNPASPHYKDQIADWAAARSHPIPLSRDRVDEIAATTATLVPGD
jgi:penicillin G amidase